MLSSRTPSNAQCATIYDQAFSGSYSCGCWTTNIRISDLPSNIVTRLVFTIQIQGANDLVWNNQFIHNNLHPMFSSGGTFQISFMPDRIDIFYDYVDNSVTINDEDILFPIAFCNKPGQAVVVHLLSNDQSPFSYELGGVSFPCQPTFQGGFIRSFPSNTISGNVQRPFGTLNCDLAINNGVPNVEVVLDDLCNNYNPPLSYHSLTNQSGNFSISGQNSGHYIHTMQKDVFTLCGVDEYDLSLIRQHILNQNRFIFPWQLIAADVDFSGYASTTDMALIQAMINGNPVYNWPSWRILPLNQYSMVTQQHLQQNLYPPLDDFIIYNPLNQDINSQIWIGVKMGDVSGNCSDCDEDNPFRDNDPELQNRSNQSVEIHTHKPIPMQDGSYYLPLSLAQNIDMGIVVLDLHPADNLTILGVYTDCLLESELPIRITDRVNDHRITTVFMEPCTSEKGSPFMHLHLAGSQIESIQSPFIDSYNTGFIFTHTGDRIDIQYAAKYEVESEEAQWVIYPNPASTEINIRLNSIEQEGQLIVYNELGQQIFNQNTRSVGSETNLNINTHEWMPGIYYIVCYLGGKVLTEKIVIQR